MIAPKVETIATVTGSRRSAQALLQRAEHDAVTRVIVQCMAIAIERQTARLLRARIDRSAAGGRGAWWRE